MRTTAKAKMKRTEKRNLFAELSEGVAALAESRQGKRTLRMHTTSTPTQKEMIRIREALHERAEHKPSIYDGLLSRKMSVTNGRMIVSCEPGEKTLPYVVSAVGDQCIMYASD